MMITLLAAAMTMSMLIATLFALHAESERKPGRDHSSDRPGFGV